MKIIYKKQTGILVSVMGEYSNPCDDEDIAEVGNIQMDKLPRYYVYNGAFVAPRHPSIVDAEIASEKFNSDTWIGMMMESLGVTKIKALGSHFTLLQWMVGQKKWKEIFEFIQEMISDNDITTEEAEKIKACFLSQGVDLNFFSPPAPTPQV